MAKITEDFNPQIFYAGSDAFEFQRVGRWPTDDLAYDQIWDSDLQNALDAHRRYMAIVNDAAPNAIKPFLPGNHDIRLFSYLRKNAPAIADKVMADFIEELIGHGIVWLGEDLDTLEVTPGFNMAHGIYANKRRATTARNTAEYWGFQQSGRVGHVHDFSEYSHRGFRYPVHVQTIGCLADLQPPYTNRRQNWAQGIGLGHLEPNSSHCSLQAIRFQRVGDKLIAQALGRQYEVSLAKTYAVATVAIVKKRKEAAA